MSGWKTMLLGDFAESVDYGVTASATEQPIGPKFLRITDIQDGAVNWENVPWCECDTRSASDARLKAGDIVFARTGATTGKSFLIRECPTDSVFASYLIRVRVGDSAEPRFVSHFFQTPNYWAQITKSARGVAQPGVNATTLKALEIPLPPLAEQRRIAEVLDRAEALRAKRRAALAQLDTLTQSLFLDLFGDPVTNPKGWLQKRIGDIGKVITGNTPSRANPAYFGNHIEWIKSDNINTPHYYLTKASEGLSESGKAVARTAQAGSILVTCIAGSPECIGNAAMADREVAFNQQINALFPTDDDRHFLYVQLLVGKRLIQEASTAGMKGMVSKGRFQQIRLILPPIELQREFARRAIAVEKLKETQLQSLAEIDALFAALQQRAFHGEI